MELGRDGGSRVLPRRIGAEPSARSVGGTRRCAHRAPGRGPFWAEGGLRPPADAAGRAPCPIVAPCRLLALGAHRVSDPPRHPLVGRAGPSLDPTPRATRAAP